jgi:hypothetical protein
MSIYLGTQQIGDFDLGPTNSNKIYLGSNLTNPGILSGSIPGSPIFHVDANNPASYPGSGSTWYTLGTEANVDLIFTGSATFNQVEGIKSNYFELDGATYFSTNNIATTVTNRTMIGWFYTENTSSVGLLAYGRGDALTDTGVSRIAFSDSNLTTPYTHWAYSPSNFQPWAVSTAEQAITGSWTMIAGVTSGTTAFLYYNGILVNTQESITTSTRTNRAVFSGTNTITPIYGRLAIMSIYQSALTSAQIQQYHSATYSLFYD